MLSVLFGEIRTGRLKRLQYLGWWIGLALLVLLVGLGIGAAIGVAERMVGGEIAQAQTMIAERFGTIGLIGIGLVFAVLAFADINISAKRVRDMGLPGWWVVLGAALVAALIATLAGPVFSQIWSLAVTLALLLIPSNAVGEASKTASV